MRESTLDVDFDVYRCQILTSQVNPRAVRVKLSNLRHLLMLSPNMVLTICLRMATMRRLSHWFLLLRSNTSSIISNIIRIGMLSSSRCEQFYYDHDFKVKSTAYGQLIANKVYNCCSSSIWFYDCFKVKSGFRLV